MGTAPAPPVDDRAREQLASPALLARFLGLGIALDVALNDQLPGAGLALFALATAITMRSSLKAGVERDLLLTGGVVFASLAALRASEMLTAMNVVVSAGLFGLAAARDDGSLLRTRVEGFIRRAVHLVLSALRAPASVLVPTARAAGSLGGERMRAAVRWIVVVVPILAVFVALLASADRIFGELLPSWPSLDLTGTASHVALITLGVLGAATLWLAATRPIPQPFPGAGEPFLPQVRFAEWAAVLGGIDVLFAIFVGVQMTFLFGGRHNVEVTPGLTYAEYARSGFFQLIVVAALAGLVILGGWDLGRRADRRQQRIFRALVTPMVALTGVILASALMRLALYEDAFGFTLNRLAGYAAIAWIAAVLVILLVAIWRGARDVVISLGLIAALATVLAVNVLNPERFVAERNVARFRSIGKIDTEYLLALGPDAVPVLVEVQPSLDDSSRAFRARLCEHMELLVEMPGGWRSANLGRASARAALAAAGITPATCP